MSSLKAQESNGMEGKARNERRVCKPHFLKPLAVLKDGKRMGNGKAKHSVEFTDGQR